MISAQPEQSTNERYVTLTVTITINTETTPKQALLDHLSSPL